jgi:hypothetical protein
MSHLDSEFQKQHNPDLKSLVASQASISSVLALATCSHFFQFQGKQVYGTICEKCKCRSERESDFLEIEVSIDVSFRKLTCVQHFFKIFSQKNGAKLEDRVAASLNPETLTGDNK